MAVQFSVALRNARRNAIESTIGTAPKLQLRTGAQPANCAAAASGTLIAEIDLPSDWGDSTADGILSKLGTWQVAAVAAGTIAHYRIVDTAGTTCHEQGSVTITSGGGDLELDNNVAAIAQTITITTWTKTEPHA